MNYITAISTGMTVLFLLWQPLPVAAFSLQQLLSPDSEKETKEEQQIAADDSSQIKQGKEEKVRLQAIIAQQEKSAIDLAYIQSIIVNLDGEQRATLLNDKATFQNFIRNEADNQSILAAALANNLDQDPYTLFLIRRGIAQALKEIYINRLINEKIPKDFPSEQQIADYYAQNTAQFIIEKRMHVWQIFLPIQKGEDQAQIDKIKKRAAQIVHDIKNKKTDFAAAAQQLDQQNSGYIGLFKVAQLVPKIKKVLLELKEGELSDPLQTDSGIHIVKRGAILDEELTPLATATPKIKEALIIQAKKRLQQAIYEQARKTYPVPLREEEIEKWRLHLKTNTDS